MSNPDKKLYNVSEWLSVTVDVKFSLAEFKSLENVTVTARHTFDVWGIIGFTDDLISDIASQLRGRGIVDIHDISIYSIDWDDTLTTIGE